MAREGVPDTNPDEWLEERDGDCNEVCPGGVQYPPATQLVLVSRDGWSRGRLGENRELVGEQGEYWERENGDIVFFLVDISPSDKEDRSQSSSSCWVANSWVKENSSPVLMRVVGGGVEVIGAIEAGFAGVGDISVGVMLSLLESSRSWVRVSSTSTFLCWYC